MEVGATGLKLQQDDKNQSVLPHLQHSAFPDPSESQLFFFTDYRKLKVSHF